MASIASRMSWIASSLEERFGAKPPSSPTDVLRPRFLQTALSAWNTSTPMRSPSGNVVAPKGMTMNSCRSTLLSACWPPFRMFIIGTGRMCAAVPPR